MTSFSNGSLNSSSSWRYQRAAAQIHVNLDVPFKPMNSRIRTNHLMYNTTLKVYRHTRSNIFRHTEVTKRKTLRSCLEAGFSGEKARYRVGISTIESSTMATSHGDIMNNRSFNLSSHKRVTLDIK